MRRNPTEGISTLFCNPVVIAFAAYLRDSRDFTPYESYDSRVNRGQKADTRNVKTMEPHQWIEKEHEPNEYGRVRGKSGDWCVRDDGKVLSLWKDRELLVTEHDPITFCLRVCARVREN